MVSDADFTGVRGNPDYLVAMFVMPVIDGAVTTRFWPVLRMKGDQLPERRTRFENNPWNKRMEHEVVGSHRR